MSLVVFLRPESWAALEDDDSDPDLGHRMPPMLNSWTNTPAAQGVSPKRVGDHSTQGIAGVFDLLGKPTACHWVLPVFPNCPKTNCRQPHRFGEVAAWKQRD